MASGREQGRKETQSKYLFSFFFTGRADRFSSRCCVGVFFFFSLLLIRNSCLVVATHPLNADCRRTGRI